MIYEWNAFNMKKSHPWKIKRQNGNVPPHLVRLAWMRAANSNLSVIFLQNACLFSVACLMFQRPLKLFLDSEGKLGMYHLGSVLEQLARGTEGEEAAEDMDFVGYLRFDEAFDGKKCNVVLGKAAMGYVAVLSGACVSM